MPVAIRGLVFDLYGTLVTRGAGPRAYRELIVSLPASAWMQAREVGLTEPIPTISDFLARFDRSGQRDPAPFERQLSADIAQVELFADTLATLERARAEGLALALLSNLAAPYKAPVAQLGLEGRFDTLVFSCDEGVAKPSPEIYARVQSRLGLRADELLMVGDSRIDDVEGPRAAGLRALHLDRSGENGDIAGLPELFQRL